MSFALFLCKAKAAALKTEDLDVPTDPITEEISLDSGLPRFMFVTIRRSKTDQQGHGKCWSYYFFTGLAMVLKVVRCFLISQSHLWENLCRKNRLERFSRRVRESPKCRIVTSAVSILRLVSLLFFFCTDVDLDTLGFKTHKLPQNCCILCHLATSGRNYIRYVYGTTVAVDFSSNHACHC